MSHGNSKKKKKITNSLMQMSNSNYSITLCKCRAGNNLSVVRNSNLALSLGALA